MNRYQEIESWLVDRMATLAQMPPDKIDIDTAFKSYALDSSVAVTLAQEIGCLLGTPQSATLFWEYPSIRTLARALATESHR